MLSSRTLNISLFTLLAAIIIAASFYRLGDFAALTAADGIIRDQRALVLSEIRLPRIFLAVFSGAALALAGNAMQGVFQNPLASPGLLGCSSGATVSSVFLLYYFSAPTVLLLLGGVSGALVAFFCVWLLARKQGSTMMILGGVAVNVLLGAVIALLLSNAESPWALAELYRWLQGSLVWARADTLLISFPFLLIGVGCLYFQRRYVDLLTFGEETAATMGIQPARSFFIVGLGVAFLLGATLPQTGVIGFIGLVAPHIARILLRKVPSQLYLPSALIGALLLLLADLALQHIALFNRIYIGTLTAILGAPFLLWIMRRHQREIYRD